MIAFLIPDIQHFVLDNFKPFPNGLELGISAFGYLNGYSISCMELNEEKPENYVKQGLCLVTSMTDDQPKLAYLAEVKEALRVNLR